MKDINKMSHKELLDTHKMRGLYFKTLIEVEEEIIRRNEEQAARIENLLNLEKQYTQQLKEMELNLCTIAQAVASLPTVTGIQESCINDHSLIRMAIIDQQETWKATVQRNENQIKSLKSELLAFEMEIRRMLWLGHGHKLIYGDDGEMQCSECLKFGVVDYKTQPLDKVRNAARLAKQELLNK